MRMLEIFLCLSFLIFLHVPTAHASVIISRTLYSGLTQGLVGHWTFDGADISDVTASDKSGNNNVGTLTNSPVRTIGKIGQALRFGGGSLVDAGDPASLRLAGSWTVSLWVNLTSLPGPTGYYALMAKDAASSKTNYGLYADGGGGFSAGIGWVLNFDPAVGGSGTIEYKTSIKSNQWYHLLGVWNGTELRLYVDGVLVGTNTPGVVPASSSGGNLNIADQACCAGDNTNGSIDEVRIYNRSLSADEVKRLYKMGGTLTLNKTVTNSSLTNGLVGHWSFDGADISGTTAFDKSGNNNRGTLTNGPTTVVGKIGQALKFDGNNDILSLSDSANLSPEAGNFSVTAWVKMSRGCVTTRCIVYSDLSSSALAGYELGVEVDNKFYGLFSDESLNFIELDGSGSSLNDGLWHFIAVIRNTQTTSVGYVDGELIDSGGSAGLGTITTNNGNTPRIGAQSGGTSLPWNGIIDDVRVYNRALSADEIKRLYKMGGTLTLNKTVTNSSLTNGLVGHWSFDGADIAGTAAYDKSGNNDRGILTNSPVSTIGKIGQALFFDGSNKYVDIADNGVFDFSAAGKYSWSYWIKPRDFAEFRSVWSQCGTCAANYFVVMVHTSNDATLGAVTKGVSLVISTSAPSIIGWHSTNNVLTENQWNHLVVTFNGSLAATNQYAIYVNGVDVTDRSDISITGVQSDISATAIAIGGSAAGAHKEFNGGIDDVRMYNRVLSADEIKRLYNMGN